MNNVTELSLEELSLIVICLDHNGDITSFNSKAGEAFADAIVIDGNIDKLIPADELDLSKLPMQLPITKKTITINTIEYQCLVHQSVNSLILLLHETVNLQNNHLTEHYLPLLDAIQVPYFQWDVNKEKVYYSSHAMALMGYSPVNEWKENTFINQHVAKEVINDFCHQVLQLRPKNKKLVYPLKNCFGDFVWVGVNISFLEYQGETLSRVIATVTDLSESKEIIVQLAEKNEYLQLVEKLTQTGHWNFNVKDKLLYWSQGVYEIFGLDPRHFQPTLESSLDCYTSNQQAIVAQHIENAISNKESLYFKSTINKGKTREKIKVEITGKVKLNEQNEVTNIYGTLRDITKIESIFEKLKLLSLVNYTIKMPIFFIDEQDQIVYLDLSPRKGKKSLVLFDYINFSITEYLHYKNEAKELGQIQYKHISFDKFDTVFNFSVTYEAEESIYIWIVDNITETFKQEQQQAINNRLTLLGNTFGNVSHDINNVLGVALGAIEMLELKAAQGETDLSGYINRVKNAIDKGKDVTGRLLAFTRKPMIRVKEFDPILDILENKYLFEQMLLGTIEFILKVEDIHCTINFPEGEFINILLNLFLNAQDAIKEKNLSGIIELSAKITRDKKLMITVKDSGVGINKDNLTKIFDPFYSSKLSANGNGIGLANVYSLMYKYDGEIRVDGQSDLGGAQFMLIFPCASIDVKQTKLPDDAISLDVRNKKILILDDEISIAEFVAMYLENEGAITNHVTNKASLINTIASKMEYDIFITDMILPDISGKEATELVRAKFPKIKIYSMSGYIADEDSNWDYPVLRKPFNSNELYRFLSRN